ncbi:MAG TPA: hypothetical protein VFL17_12590, partial [Anaerolineae bacterium]|nr:hypothetical protein [Anaerolineae bacterium]
NLETGLTGDARTGRRVTLKLERRHLDLDAGDYVLRGVGGGVIRSHVCSTGQVCFSVSLGPESAMVFVVEPAEAPAGEIYEP